MRRMNAHRRDRRAEHVRRRRALRHRTPSCRPRPSSGASTSTSPASAAPAPSSPAPAPTHGAGPDTYCMGGNAENVLGMEWVTPEGEIVRTGSLGSGDGWFCSEGPGPACAASAGARSAAAAAWASTPSAPSSWPALAGPTDWHVDGHAPGLPPARATRPCAPTRSPSPTGTPGRTSTTRSTTTRSATSSTASSTWPAPTSPPPSGSCTTTRTKTLSDVPGAGRASPSMAELTEEMRISFQLILAGRSEGRHRAAGQDPRRHPRGSRRLEGRALLRAGHGRVHQHVPAAARPQAHQLRLGRRLHRQLDAVRHAGLGQGLRARRPRRASSATPPAACSCSAAATR